MLVSFIASKHKKTVFGKYKVLNEKTGIIIANEMGKEERYKYAKFKKLQSELIALGSSAVSIKKRDHFISNEKHSLASARALLRQQKDDENNSTLGEDEPRDGEEDRESVSSSGSDISTLTSASKKRDRRSSPSPILEVAAKKHE